MTPEPAASTTVQPVTSSKPPIPWWGWVFAAACAVIPILTLGGAIPAAIGVGGAGGCVAVARNAGMSAGARAVICGGILVLCWAAFLALVVVVAMARSGAAS